MEHSAMIRTFLHSPAHPTDQSRSGPIQIELSEMHPMVSGFHSHSTEQIPHSETMPMVLPRPVEQPRQI
jgi:hypothetical protein